MQWLAVASVVITSAACSGSPGASPASESEPIRSLEEALTRMPTWLRPMNAGLTCGARLEDAFAGRDSAHGYRIDARAGRRYALELAGSYSKHRGAAIAVYDGKTGLSVASKTAGAASEARLTFEPPRDGEYVVGVYTVRGVGEGPYAVSATCEVPGMNDRTLGETDFTSYEEAWPDVWSLAKADASGPRAPAGRLGPVEEADIFRVAGNEILYLNTYRGLVVLDATDATRPTIVSRLPLFGRPVEMFVQGDVVYALVSDVLRLTARPGAAPRFERRDVSQLVTIDISDRRAPKILQSIDMIGGLEEGVSRKVGDTVYVVSTQYRDYWMRVGDKGGKEQAWVYSFDVSDPGNVRKVQELQIFEGGGYSEWTTASWRSRWFSDVKIAATSNALLVAENWNTYGAVSGSTYACGDSASQDQAIVSVIDISDPKGAIRRFTRLETYGHITDQFKQTYVVDPQTGKATFYGIFARQEWSTHDCKGASHVENAIEAWDVTDGASPRLASKLAFGKPDELVRGSLFDVGRGLAYAITARQIDPLYAIDIHDPGKLVIKSAIDGLSGEMSVFRFVGGGQYLLGVGTDTSETCTGFQGAATGFGTRIAASVIDVRDASAIRLVQRQCVAVKDASWVSSGISWNLDQAHKMIGVDENGADSLISVPVDYWRQTGSGSTSRWSRESAVGLLGFDLSKDDPALAPAKQRVLTNLGTSVQPTSPLKRAAIVRAPALGAGRKLLGLSPTAVTLTDIRDARYPVPLSKVEIAANETDVVRFGAHVVVQVSPSWEQDDADAVTEFRVKPVSLDLSSTPAVATFQVARVERVVQVGDLLVVLHRAPSTSTWVPGQPWQPAPMEAVVFDMTNPARPTETARLAVPLAYVPWAATHADARAYVLDGEPTALVVLEDAIAILSATWSRSSAALSHELVVLDLARKAAPVVRRVDVTPASATTQLLGLVPDVDARSVFLASREVVGSRAFEGTTFAAVKYHAEHWMPRGGAWKAGTRTNVPGRLFAATEQDGEVLFLSQEYVHDVVGSAGFRAGTRLAVSKKEDAWATLTDTREYFGKALHTAALDGSTVYADVGERWYWSPTPAAPAKDQLAIYGIDGGQLVTSFQKDLGVPQFHIVAAEGERLYVTLPGDGVLALDVRDPGYPVGQAFVRTFSWTDSVEVAGDVALIPAGQYGVHAVDLTAPPAISVE